VSTERTYHSTLREEQAHQTKLRVRKAARSLFAEQGFAATTVAQIAKEAGVAPATVYATFESKAGIVVGMLDDLEESIEVGPRLREAFDVADARQQLRMYVSAHCDLFADGADILRAAMQAIEAPGVAALMERGDARRRGVIEAFVKGWHEQEALRAGLSPKAAAERLWLLTTVEGFLNAVDRLGWSATEYEAWIGDLAEAEILGPAV